MRKSVAMMQKEWKLFLRQVLFFLAIRLGANLLASMWSYILDNSSLPDMLLSAFYVLYLSPCFILVQAKFYQEILKKQEILGRVETPEPEERSEAEEQSAVAEQEQHALSQPEEVSTEWRDESVRETEELQQKEDIAEPQEENTEQQEEKVEKQEEKEEQAKEQAAKPEEKKEEELSFEEARKRYTDYKEES